MTNITFNRLVFAQFRVIPVSMGDNELTNEGMLKAVTANQELINMGYILSPKDVIELAKSRDLDIFMDIVKYVMGDMRAKPMYPNFPTQVMEMDEATFRFHQMLHYMSTYGVELFTGTSVSKGWLPETTDTEKTESDETLLKAQTISLININDVYTYAYSHTVAKRERMDSKDELILDECLQRLETRDIPDTKVAFKENLVPIFSAIFSAEISNEDKNVFLHNICQHTGDVYKCIRALLDEFNFNFRTSQKRLLVKLLETYSIQDFRENLIYSNKKREEVLMIIRYLDYNEYSRKPEFKAAVKELRNDELKSWDAKVKKLVAAKSKDALTEYARRPGIMLRNLTYLLRNGYDAWAIGEAIADNSASLKTQTIVQLMNHFGRDESKWDDKEKFVEANRVYNILIDALKGNLSAKDIESLRGKKVYVDESEFDLELSTIRVNDKSEEGGYIRSGIAYKIPENVSRIRFFIYWNDKRRVDVDLHTCIKNSKGEEFHVGWCSDFRVDEVVAFSGDITHSDAAEYIDIDLTKAVDAGMDHAQANIDLYTGARNFGDIDECYVGAMAVNKIGEEVKLYDPKNCFFTHFLTSKMQTMNYGYIDIAKRVIVFDGTPSKGYYTGYDRNNAFTLRTYIWMLLNAQGAEWVDHPEEADVNLVMGKPMSEKDVSLADANFFMD